MVTSDTAVLGYALAIVGVIGATVAVCLGHIDAETYIALVGPVVGAGVGVGAHAAGVTTATKQVPPLGTPGA